MWLQRVTYVRVKTIKISLVIMIFWAYSYKESLLSLCKLFFQCISFINFFSTENIVKNGKSKKYIENYKFELILEEEKEEVYKSYCNVNPLITWTLQVYWSQSSPALFSSSNHKVCFYFWSKLHPFDSPHNQAPKWTAPKTSYRKGSSIRTTRTGDVWKASEAIT